MNHYLVFYAIAYNEVAHYIMTADDLAQAKRIARSIYGDRFISLIRHY